MSSDTQLRLGLVPIGLTLVVLGCAPEEIPEGALDGSVLKSGPCGNGQIDRGEICDDGYQDECGSCNANCTDVGSGGTCGDGRVCPETELCDDGNATDADGCALCVIEAGWTCVDGVGCALCGDGKRQNGEECDDGNDATGDGCDLCSTESGWSCADGASCTKCGDGALEGAEECDDGGNAAGDGCSADCRIECPEGVYDASTDLCWVEPAELSAVALAAARDFCGGLNTGASTWRLPSVTELRSLIVGCPSTELGGACPVGEISGIEDTAAACNGCALDSGSGPNGCYWDGTFVGACDDLFWSSTPVAGLATHAWAVRFNAAVVGISPVVGTGGGIGLNYTRCVREGP